MSRITPPPLADWLVKLEVTLTSPVNQLYANGRQQVELQFLLEPRPGQSISSEEFSSLRLMVADDSGGFYSLTETPTETGWSSSSERNKYDYYPQSSSTVSTDTNERRTSAREAHAIYRRWRYVSNSSLRAGSRLTVYAGITHFIDDDAVEYITDSSEPGFNSWVDLVTEPIPQYELGDYLFEYEQLSGGENSDIQLREYYLGISRIPFLWASALPAGMIQWDERQQSSTRASHVGYAPPNTTNFLYNCDIALGDQFTPVLEVQNPRQGQVALIVQSDNTIPYDSNSAINHGGPLRLTAIDVHGNEHILNVRFSDPTPTGRLSLKLLPN